MVDRATVLACVLMCVPAVAAADERGRTLDDLRALQAACRDAREPGRRELYAVELPPGAWRLGAYVEDGGYLAVDTRRNLRAFGGAAELLASHLEPVGFVASPSRARALRRTAEAGTLRVGFFLGFDDPARSACLVRPAVGVTTVRMDLAFVELLAPSGEVIAREGGDRLRAWLDDAEQDAIPGEGPRGALGRASAAGAGTVPQSWQDAIAAANRGPVARAIGRCHADGVRRGAAGDGQVVVALGVDPSTGAVRTSEVELSTVGDQREDACIATAVGRLRFAAVPGAPGRLSLPVRLRD